MVFLILGNINKKENSSKPGLNEELLIWSQSIFKYFIAQMEPLQLSFPSSHKGPVLQGYLLPLGGAGSCFLSIYVCFLGRGLGSGKENRLLKCRTEQLSLMPLLFSPLLPSGHGCPRGVWLAADLPPSCMMPGEPTATFQSGLV